MTYTRGNYPGCSTTRLPEACNNIKLETYTIYQTQLLELAVRLVRHSWPCVGLTHSKMQRMCQYLHTHTHTNTWQGPAKPTTYLYCGSRVQRLPADLPHGIHHRATGSMQYASLGQGDTNTSSMLPCDIILLPTALAAC